MQQLLPAPEAILRIVRSASPAAAREPLEESQRLKGSILDSSPDCIMMLDLEGRILFVNDSCARALQAADARSLCGSLWTDLLTPDAEGEAGRALAAARQGRVARFTWMETAADGSSRCWEIVATPVFGEDGGPVRLAVMSRDTTHQKSTEEQVRWAANHDPLTKLPNRTLFQQRLDQLIREAGARGQSFGLLLLDVDDFKTINDTLGHDAGDALLSSFAERLRLATGSRGMVARLGGDEFAIILWRIDTHEELRSAGEAVLEQLREPCVYEGRRLECQASVGAAVYPHDGSGKAELVKHADIALYAAKDAGRGTLKIFEPAMRVEMQSRISMLGLARDALVHDRIIPFYQPKIDLMTGDLNGFEALLRWQHPQQGLQNPDTIAAAFQDLTLAADISDRMIDRVIKDVQGWLEAGVNFGHVAINAAAAEFRRGDFAERLLEQLNAARIPTSCIQLEVTETVFLGRGAECVERALVTLSEAGIQVALDDFGTGYASLSHLKQFPVNIIKIDRSFIRNLQDDPHDEAIVRAVIDLGRNLNIKIVAEGIETRAQCAYLRKSGCNFGQGYLFGPALARGAIIPLIESIASREAVSNRALAVSRRSAREARHRASIGRAVFPRLELYPSEAR